MRLRLVAAMARLMAKPDRISARSLDLSSSFETGPLNAKQLKLAKFAYIKGGMTSISESEYQKWLRN